MCIDFFFLIKEHKALKNNCSSLQHFTFLTRQKAQPPAASEKLKGERHRVGSPECPWPPRCPAPLLGLQTPGATNASSASDQVISLNFPLWADVSSSILEKKELSVLFTFKWRCPEGKRVNVYKVFCSPEGDNG